MSKERIERLHQRLKEERKRKQDQREEAMKRKQSTNCSICRLPLDDPYGHNAWPVNEGRCCEDCNASVVISTRIKILYGGLTQEVVSISEPQEGEIK